jgi:hypothetical protein
MTMMGTKNEASTLMHWRICGTAEWPEHEELMRKTAEVGTRKEVWCRWGMEF